MFEGFGMDRSFAFMPNRVRTQIPCALSRLVSSSLDRRELWLGSPVDDQQTCAPTLVEGTSC